MSENVADYGGRYVAGQGPVGNSGDKPGGVWIEDDINAAKFPPNMTPPNGLRLREDRPESGAARNAEDQDKPDDSWYSERGIEPWQFILAYDLNFFEGSIIKYITRWRYKNGVEDLRKVIVYADELLRQAEIDINYDALNSAFPAITVTDYVVANNMSFDEGGIVQAVELWRKARNPGYLRGIAKAARRLISNAEQETTL